MADPVWIKKHEISLVTDALNIIGGYAYRFLKYTTTYNPKKEQDSLNLFFKGITHDAIASCHFNVSVRRTRSIKGHKAGERLPEGQFIVKEGSKFLQFWQSTELGMPRSLSEFPSVIRRLKRLAFIGETYLTNKGARFKDKMLIPLTIPYSAILNALNLREEHGNSTVKMWEEHGKKKWEDIPAPQ
jgi:hypothetical protein